MHRIFYCFANVYLKSSKYFTKMKKPSDTRCAICQNNVYLRQFFICREERRKGYGRQSFYELINYLEIQEIDIDVYSWNETGIKFWQSVGFEKRLYNMRYKRE